MSFPVMAASRKCSLHKTKSETSQQAGEWRRSWSSKNNRGRGPRSDSSADNQWDPATSRTCTRSTLRSHLHEQTAPMLSALHPTSVPFLPSCFHEVLRSAAPCSFSTVTGGYNVPIAMQSCLIQNDIGLQLEFGNDLAGRWPL